MFHKELSELQTQWDQIREKNKQLEMTLYIQHDQSRGQVWYLMYNFCITVLMDCNVGL